MSGRGAAIRQRVAETLELPEDIVMDVPKVTIIGNVQMNIENHQGIIELGSDKVRINTNIGVLKITGSRLVIKSIDSEEIIIAGNIENIDILC